MLARQAVTSASFMAVKGAGALAALQRAFSASSGNVSLANISKIAHTVHHVAAIFLSVGRCCSGGSSNATSLPLGTRDDGPVLIQLPQRSWGAAAHLSAEAVRAALGQ